MCLSSPSPPPAPPRMKPAPPVKAPAPPPEIPTQDRMDDEESEKAKLSTRKKKALEIKKTKEGTKTLGAIDPNAAILNPNTNQAPSTGVNTPI